ncbi:hypothetical protein ACGK9U_06640 [Mariniflexile sp. HNIBRBA6329]|uniref:hypothetical protein n=1 Tax=Mariniflexile sp. HNIBRBA6329 TaxID=3373088 RepID=UPI00374684B5
MGFIGIIILVVIGIIVYNIYFNLKYSEGEQIMMRFKKEQKQKQNLTNEYVSRVINDLFTERQKLATIMMLDVISIGFSNNEYKLNLQKDYIDNLTKSFNLADNRIIDYTSLIGANLKIHMNDLKTFEKPQMLYLVTFLTDLMKLGGNPTNKQVEISQDRFVKFSGISHTEFNSLLDEINSIANFSNNKY